MSKFNQTKQSSRKRERGISINSSLIKEENIEGNHPFRQNPLTSFTSPSIIHSELYSDILKTFPKERDLINFFTFCSALRIFNNFNRKTLKKESDLFCKINAHTIRYHMTSMSQDYNKLIMKMIENGFLECDNSYCPQKYCYGYRFGPKMEKIEWQKPNFEEFLKTFAPKTGHKKVFQRIPFRLFDKIVHWENAKTEWVREVGKRVEELGKELSVFYPENFTEMAQQVAEEKYNEYMIKYNRGKKDKKPLAVEHFLADHIRNLTQIQNLEFSAFIDENGFSPRLFTQITSLPSAHRGLLRYQGDQMTNIDLRCAQCCLLAALYDDSPESIEEKKKFIQAMQNPDEDFYTLLGRQAGIERKTAKTRIFIIMFGENSMQNGKICDGFKSLFPILTSLIYKEKEKNYKNVAQIMQRTESLIIVQTALLRLFALDVPAFSIHDSILTTAPHVETVKSHISAAFSEIMGFAPVLKID